MWKYTHIIFKGISCWAMEVFSDSSVFACMEICGPVKLSSQLCGDGATIHISGKCLILFLKKNTKLLLTVPATNATLSFHNNIHNFLIGRLPPPPILPKQPSSGTDYELKSEGLQSMVITHYVGQLSLCMRSEGQTSCLMLAVFAPVWSLFLCITCSNIHLQAYTGLTEPAWQKQIIVLNWSLKFCLHNTLMYKTTIEEANVLAWKIKFLVLGLEGVF